MSLTSSALIMSHRTMLTCSCALLSHSKSVMEPLKIIPEFHPIPFKQGKYLSIKTRTLTKYNETRSGITERIDSLETTLNKLKTQAACAMSIGESETMERESMQLPPPLLHLPLPLAEEVTHLYSKVNSVQGENGFVLDDALIYNFFHSLIASGDYRTALMSVLHDKIIAEARGPPFPLQILEDLNYVLRCYVIPQLPCSTAHFSRIVPLLLDMCNHTNTNLLSSFTDNTNNMTATHTNNFENNNYQNKKNTSNRRREMQRVMELAVQEEIAFYSSKYMSQHNNGKQERYQVDLGSEVSNVDVELPDEVSSLTTTTNITRSSWHDSVLFSTLALTSSYEQSAHCHYIIEEFVLPIWQAASQMGLFCLPNVKESINSREQNSSNIVCHTSESEYEVEDDDNSTVCRAELHKNKGELEWENDTERFEELLLPKNVAQSVISRIVHCFDEHYHVPLTTSIANSALGNVHGEGLSKSTPQCQNSKEQQQEQLIQNQMTSSNRYTDKLQVLESILQFYLNLACIASEVQDEHWLMQMLKLFCSICLQKNKDHCNKQEVCKGVLQDKFAIKLNVQDWCNALLYSDSIYKRKQEIKDDDDDVAGQVQIEFEEKISELLRCFASEYLPVIYYGLHNIQRERQLLYAVELQQWQTTLTEIKESLLSSLTESLSSIHAPSVAQSNSDEEFVSDCNTPNNVNDIIKDDLYGNNTERNENGDVELQNDWQDMYDRSKNEKGDEIINEKANELLHKAMCKVIIKTKETCGGMHACNSIDNYNSKVVNKEKRSNIHALIKQFLTSVLVEQNEKEQSKVNNVNKENDDDDDNPVVKFAEPILNYILVTQDVEWLTTLSANDYWRSSLRQVLSSDEEWELYNALVKSNVHLPNSLTHSQEKECSEKLEEVLKKLTKVYTFNKINEMSNTSYKHWYTFSEKLLQSTTAAIQEESKAKINSSNIDNNKCTYLSEAKSVVFERLQRITDGLVELFTSTHINKCTWELLLEATSTHHNNTDLNNDNNDDFSNESTEKNINKKAAHQVSEYSHYSKNIHKQTSVVDQNVATYTTITNLDNEPMSVVLFHFVSMLMHEASIVSSSDFALVLTPYSITSLAFLMLNDELTSSKEQVNWENTNFFLSKLANVAINQLQCYKRRRVELEQHNNHNNNNITNGTNNETCDLIKINNLEMLYTGNALSLFLLALARRHMWDNVLPLLRAMCGVSVEGNLDCDESNINKNTNTTSLSSSPSSSLASTHDKFERSVSFITCQSMSPIVLHTLFRLARNDGACMICAELRQHRQDIFF